MDKSGIYTITNIINNKIYVGYATNFRKRKASHISDLRKNKHKNIHLQRAFNKDGESNFKIEIIEECDIDNLIIREDYWCKKLNTHNPEFGYNLLGTGEIGLITHSLESRNKISKSKLGSKQSDSHIENNRLSKLGHITSDETKDKLKAKTYTFCKEGKFKLNEQKILEIVNLFLDGKSSVEIAKMYNVGKHTIQNIRNGKSWFYVTKINKK